MKIRGFGPKISKIGGSKDVYEFMQPLIGELQYEEFWIVYLNNSNRILQKWRLSIGGMTGTAVDIRLVYKKAIEINPEYLIPYNELAYAYMEIEDYENAIETAKKYTELLPNSVNPMSLS